MSEWKDRLLEQSEPTVWPAIDCGDGWRPIVEAFYAYVTRHDCLYIDQIKEKYGGIRLYFSHRHQCEECSDFEVNRHYHIVAGMEAVADHMCERCGSADAVALRGGGWIRTLCDECHGSSETLADIKAQREKGSDSGR